MINTFLGLVLLVSGLQSAWGFALLGPTGNGGDSWQVPTIAYGLGGDIGAPKNIGEEYRRNTPVMYYTYDANFYQYFGSNGVAAVDAAFAILNALTNVDSYSSSLAEFPLNSQFSYDSSALGLTDLKSTTLFLLMEQMGLAEPERYIWTLHDRYLPPGGVCPLDEEYLVVQRNYDPVTGIYSSYVNGTLYTYDLFEICSGPNPLAFTFPIAVDPTADTFTAVAGLGSGLRLGSFYAGLTRDDVAGLRYLLTTNNAHIHREDAAAGSLQVITNISAPVLVTTLSLGDLVAASKTNNPDALLLLYPGLVISSVTTNYAVVATTNYVTYLTNQIGAPFGSPPIQVTVPAPNGITYSLGTFYSYTFGNVITNSFSTSTLVNYQTVTVTNLIGSPFNSPVSTNTIPHYVLTTNVSGDFYLIPANWCGYTILTNFPGQLVSSTNSGTVAASSTNQFGTAQFAQTIITSFTSHNFLIQPDICQTVVPTPQLRQGIGRIQFVRANFDSLLNQFNFPPVTNTYSMVAVVNSQLVPQRFQRIVTQPDILFSAEDTASPAFGQIGAHEAVRNINFDQNNILNNLAGPGTINPSTTITYNKVGDIFFNTLGTNQFMSEFTQVGSLLTWGSFDATTNAPVLYPDTASLQNLQYQILIQISPTILPDGTNNVLYSMNTPFTATGGAFTPPYTWSLGTDLTGVPTSLPAGLVLSSGGMISGTPANNPPGTYDFVIQLTDSLSRTVHWNYSITIH